MVPLEMIGVVSTETHKRHHQHNLQAIDDAEIWFDLWVPSFINQFFETYWKYLLTLYVKNQQNMIEANDKWLIKFRTFAISSFFFVIWLIT
jgi:hypothetical protein